jgi:ascorbate-specific PTS system EIIC-type component UlaA
MPPPQLISFQFIPVILSLNFIRCLSYTFERQGRYVQKLIILVLGGKAIVTDLYGSFEGFSDRKIER